MQIKEAARMAGYPPDMPHAPLSASDTLEEPRSQHEVIGIAREFVRELHGRRPRAVEITPQSRLDRDLGIDSLGRAELILRIERGLQVQLPPTALSEAATLADLITMVEARGPRLRASRTFAPAPESLPQVPASAGARTLTQMLDWHVARHPDRLHVTLLEDETTVLGSMTYAQLAGQAHRIAAGLIARDIVPGDCVALMLPTNLDFFAAFFGVLYAGAIPVPIYPPARLSEIEEHTRRQAGILRNAGATLLITVPEAARLGTLLRGQVETLRLVESAATLAVTGELPPLPPSADENATAFIQYTSGSTGDPKGVVLSHANLLANIRALGTALDATSADIFVSWLPLYHDFGLIGAWLGSLYYAASFYVMSPLSFLVRPQSWLWAVHRYRATLSAAPNFAYEFCVEKIADADLAGLDLSSLRCVANGAEPVSVPSFRRFIERFNTYGFKPEAMCPAYGLAENTLGLTFPPPGRPPLVDRVDRASLSMRGVAEPAKADDRTALEIVSCGQPLPDHEVRIVDETGREVGDRREGRLEFRGPSATSGYFHNEAKTRELFHDGWLDSGDQAYVANGEVYITGRIKDIIIRAGQHIYPHEIEEAVGEIPGVVKNGVAAFGIVEARSGTERTVVMAETAASDNEIRKALQDLIREATMDILGAPPDEVVLAPPGAVPKTSSGKIRRGAARDLYLHGEAGTPQRTVRWQLARLFLAGVAARLSRLPRLVGALLYAGWWWTVIVCVALVGWLAVMTLPGIAWRWAVVRKLARAALKSLGIPLTVTGGPVPSRDAVVVFNHASYADGLVAAAVLPDAPAFIAKREFARQLVAGPFLRRLGAVFVERFDVAGSLADAATAAQTAHAGRLLVVFPEGTFTRRAGLTDFYLGAFRIAADAGLPVVPGAIQGTRSLLRSDQWFPRRTAVSVHFDAPVRPTGTDFSAVVQLRDEVRAAVLRHCGEPDLAGLVKPAAPIAAG
jgi:1-acyl-sn-glycerol-3-phosphate acyltransferase